ncbi:MBL fold metallo-hydrolase [Paenibacillus baimaensis]|nr:MBL fold metallo-hydrolase [Paenibacillus sp. WQ 127069]
METVKDTLTLWGTGDSMGVPRVYCSCGVCTEARTSGANRRFRSSALLHTSVGTLLIDCGPEWRTQMEHYGLRSLEHVLITHAHFDHIAGLPEWADACRYSHMKGHVYAPADVLTQLRTMFPWLENQLDYHDCSGSMVWGEWVVRPWKVCHGKNGFSYAYRFDKHTDQPYHFAYCSDAINLNEEEKAPLFGLQLLIIGTNFYKEESAIETRSVYDMTEALELLQETKPEHTIFTHMSHGVDVLEQYGLPVSVVMARTGMILELE